jgi:hypothetical protein
LRESGKGQAFSAFVLRATAGRPAQGFALRVTIAFAGVTLVGSG